LLIHLAPKDTPEKYLEILRNNQQLFLNSHDIYATLRSLAEGKLPDRKAECDRNSTIGSITAYSYFHEDLPKKRDCESRICSNCDLEVFENPFSFIDYKKTQARNNEKGYFYLNPWV
jgi:hypothetical protein